MANHATTSTKTTETVTADGVIETRPANGAPSAIAAVMTETERRIEQYKLALEPVDSDSAWKEANRAVQGKLCGVQDAFDAYARIMTGRSLGKRGLGVMTSLRSIYIIEGQPCLAAKLKVALLLERPDLIEYCEPVEVTPTKATWRAKRVGRGEVQFSYTIEMAQQAQLVDRGKDDAAKKKNNWNRFPANMLSARASSFLCDMVASDLTLGLSTVEEMTDEAELRAETRSFTQAAPPQAALQRDFEAEMAALKQSISDAKTPEDKKAVRTKIAAWLQDAGEMYRDEMNRYYALIHGAPAKTATNGQAAATQSAPAAQPPPPAAAASPTAPRVREPGEEG